MNDIPSLPWWRYRMVWLVVGGPAAVVVASFVTLFLAVHGADRPLPRAHEAAVIAAPAHAHPAEEH
jgi:hypothetical protein